MKKRILRIITITFFIMICFSGHTLGSQEEILQSQSESLNIKGFVEKANDYTKEVFDGMDANELLNNAIQGKIDNKTIFSKIINLFGKEIKETFKIIRKYYCDYCNT